MVLGTLGDPHFRTQSIDPFWNAFQRVSKSILRGGRNLLVVHTTAGTRFSVSKSILRGGRNLLVVIFLDEVSRLGGYPPQVGEAGSLILGVGDTP